MVKYKFILLIMIFEHNKELQMLCQAAIQMCCEFDDSESPVSSKFYFYGDWKTFSRYFMTNLH